MYVCWQNIHNRGLSLDIAEFGQCWFSGGSKLGTYLDSIMNIDGTICKGCMIHVDWWGEGSTVES